MLLECSRPRALWCWRKSGDFSGTQSTCHPCLEEGKLYPSLLTEKPVPGNSEDEMWLSQPVTQKSNPISLPGHEFRAAGCRMEEQVGIGGPSQVQKDNCILSPLNIDNRRDSGMKNKGSQKIKHLRVEIFERAIWQLLLLACWQCKLYLASWKATPNKPYPWQLEALK